MAFTKLSRLAVTKRFQAASLIGSPDFQNPALIPWSFSDKIIYLGTSLDNSSYLLSPRKCHQQVALP